MKNLKGNIANPIVFDIKIGKSTASYDEIRKKTKSRIKAAFKKIKMTLSDWATGSRSPLPWKSSRGWRLIPQKGQGNRFITGRSSKVIITNQLNTLGVNYNGALNIIITKMTEMIKILCNSNFTFVASSVLIIIDPNNPANTNVNLIDFAHPLIRGDPGYENYKSNFLHGFNNLLTFFQELQAHRPHDEFQDKGTRT